MKRIVFFSLAVFALVNVSAFSREECPFYQQFDHNGDGEVVIEDLDSKDFPQGRVPYSVFKRADLNKDGVLAKQDGECPPAPKRR